jgi:hypothetical protein
MFFVTTALSFPAIAADAGLFRVLTMELRQCFGGDLRVKVGARITIIKHILLAHLNLVCKVVQAKPVIIFELFNWSNISWFQSLI